MTDEQSIETPPETATQPKLLSLKEVEDTINAYVKAQGIHKLYGLHPDQFVFRLVSKLDRGEASYIPGNPVEIVLLWPFCSMMLNEQINTALRTVARHRMWRTTAIVPMAYVKEGRKMAKLALGEAAEILTDLISRQRIRVSTETIVTFRDAKTGETVCASHKSKEDRYDGNHIGLWLELSRIVNEKYPIIEDDASDVEDESTRQLRLMDHG